MRVFAWWLLQCTHSPIQHISSLVHIYCVCLNVRLCVPVPMLVSVSVCVCVCLHVRMCVPVPVSSVGVSVCVGLFAWVCAAVFVRLFASENMLFLKGGSGGSAVDHADICRAAVFGPGQNGTNVQPKPDPA